MKSIVLALLLALPICAIAENNNDQTDLRHYPPDPDSVDAGTLPHIVSGLTSGMPFFVARKKIIANGWKPLNLKKKWLAQEEPDCGLLDCELHRKGVVEVEGCPTDKPVCVFYYHKGKSWLQLMATGEELQTLTVYYWANQSPELH